MRTTMALALVVLAGCGSEAVTSDPGGPQDVAVGSKSDCPDCVEPESVTPVPATLTFDHEYARNQEQFTGALYQGGTAQVAFHPDRFTHCRRTQTNGFETTGFLRGEDGEIVSFEAGWGTDDVVNLPQTGSRVELWFRGAPADGSCEEWDSKGGANYVFELHPFKPTVVTFKADWSELASGVPSAGGTLVLDYDSARLTRCRASYNGGDAWSIMAYVRYDSGEELSAATTAGAATNEGYRQRPTLVNFLIPPGATEAELWFKNSDYAGCTAYDSNHNQNYRIAIE